MGNNSSKNINDEEIDDEEKSPRSKKVKPNKSKEDSPEEGDNPEDSKELDGDVARNNSSLKAIVGDNSLGESSDESDRISQSDIGGKGNVISNGINISKKKISKNIE